ncbi:MAG: hypothetical protein MPJ50_10310 [Pirellulales bacterium]|nr:hypothetical protein [Pirellulales bacterium]
MKFPQPWFRKSRRAWYVTLDGQQIRLGTTKDESLAHYQRLMATPRNRSATGSLTGIR